MRNSTWLKSVALSTMLLALACKGEEASSSYQYDCRVWIAPASASDKPVTGVGTAADETAATEAAWQDVCAKLPDDKQAACRDEAQFKASVTTSKGTDNVTVAIGLTPAQSSQIDERAVSDKDEASACSDALLAACKKAGAEGDCVAAGTHVKKGEASGKNLVKR